MGVFLGGRAAEEMKFGEISTGAHNDLFGGTDIARRIGREYGMSQKIGPLSFEKERQPLFVEGGMGASKEYSENTAMEIDKEVGQIVIETYEKLKNALEGKKDKLEKVVKLLLVKEVIEGEELRRLIA